MNKHTGISKKWKPVARAWVGNKYGIHCHWCKHKWSEDGEVYCNHKDSKFNDGKRIRTWDGNACAEDCGYFELDDWYKEDKNFDEYFGERKND